jgi:hypothetical protein
LEYTSQGHAPQYSDILPATEDAGRIRRVAHGTTAEGRLAPQAHMV